MNDHKTNVLAWPKEKNKDRNPYNKILYDVFSEEFSINEFIKKKVVRSRCDILHMHWPDHMLRLKAKWKIKLRLWKFRRLIQSMKNKGVKIVWTVHNMQPHESYFPRLMEDGLKLIVSLTDGFIFLSKESRRTFLAKYTLNEDQKTTVIPHIHYKNYYASRSKADALARLVKYPKGLQILCFGLIRPHKGYERLFELACQIEGVDNVGWMLAGKPAKEGMSKKLLTELEKNNIVFGAYRHIDDCEVPDIFSAADAVFLPYEHILNSGTAILALSLNRRVIAPKVGSLVELQKMVGSEWVYLYEPPLTKVALEASIEWLDTDSMSATPDLSAMNPELAAGLTQNFYNMLLKN